MTAPIAPAEPTAPAPTGTPIQQAIDARKAQATAPAAPAAPFAPEPPADPVEPTEVLDLNAEPVPEGETPEVTEGESEPLDTIDLPGRRPGDPDLSIEVDDPVVANRIREALNSYERKTESTARFEEASKMVQSVREFEAQIAIDPMGVVQQTLDPQRQMHLALRLFSQNAEQLTPIFQAVLTDPNQMQVLEASLEAESYRLKEQAQSQIQETRQAERNASDLLRGVDALIPEGLTGHQRALWKDDALNAVREYVRQNNVRVLHPMDLPAVLAARLRAFNVAPENAAARLHQTFARSTGAAPEMPRPNAPTNGEQLRRAAQARRAASQAAPTGAGAPTAALPKAPPGAGVRETINHLRAQRGLAPK